MKISSKLILSSFLPLATAAVILVLIASSIRQEREAEEKTAVSLAMFKAAFDLGHRVNYYLLYQESRSASEWFTLHDSLSNLVRQTPFANLEQDQLITSIRTNVDEMKPLFTALVNSHANPLWTGKGKMLEEVQNRLATKLLVRTRYLSSDALRLYEFSSRERNRLVSRTHLLSLSLIIVSALVMVVILLPMNRSIVLAIRRLMDGAAELGAGKLTHRIGLHADNEIGQLSEEFDHMAEHLEEITVSRDELTREMEVRRKAEAALRSSEERFRWMYDSGLIAMAFWNTEGGITEANRSFCRMIGVEPEELRVQSVPWDSVTPPELLLRDQAAFQQMVAWGYCEAYEKELISRRGHRRVPVMIAATFIAGSQREAISFAIDLTERKKAEEALRSSEATLKLAVESTGIGTFDFYPASGLLIWSETTRHHFGLLPETPVDYATFIDGIHPDDRQKVEEVMAEVLQPEHPGAVDLECRTIGIHDGRERWVVLRGRVLRDEHNQAVRLLGTTLDLTERKQSEENLRQALAEVERSNRELEQFAYVASHDLQEPLRMVASFVQLLGRKYRGQLDRKADEYIHYAVEGALRMQKLIEELLAYSRINREGSFDFVNTNDLFAETLANLAVTLRENEATVTRDYLPVVWGNEVQLLQLFQNLIGNAIKYRRADVPPLVCVDAERKGGEWVFSVRDNGIGIEPAHYDRVFLIFQRLHGRHEYPGTGIGLALCKRIVERHGGHIWIESVVGEGTTFFFTLPLRRGSTTGGSK